MLQHHSECWDEALMKENDDGEQDEFDVVIPSPESQAAGAQIDDSNSNENGKKTAQRRKPRKKVVLKSCIPSGEIA